MERGSPHSLCLLESGKLLPGVKVIIANPETKGQCGDSHLGEVKNVRREGRKKNLRVIYREVFGTFTDLGAVAAQRQRLL